jgi:hypothetical protein
MGNFYVNHTVRAPQDRVVAVLEAERRIAFVGPTQDNFTVVCDQESDSQDEVAIVALGRSLSGRLDSPVLAVLNHDDDILCYWLFEHGKLIEQFNSCPDYFDDDDFGGLAIFDDQEEEDDLTEPAPGLSSAGAELCRVFGKPEQLTDVQAILAENQLFALFTHQKLVESLGLPAAALATGYRYIAEGDAELDADECVHVGGKVSSPTGWVFDDDEDE